MIDASVVVEALAGSTVGSLRARDALRSRALHAPHVLDLEVLSALRRATRAGAVDESRARAAVGDLESLEVERYAHRAFARRIWELRDNLTPYDAAYVALAETIGVPLVTFDAALASAPGSRCPIELIG